MEFPKNAPSAAPVFYRTYSRRKPDGIRESWSDACDRTLAGTQEIGNLSPEQMERIEYLQRNFYLLPSGRFLWIGNTPWSKEQKNFNGSYNCTTTSVVDWESFGLMMSLCMQGCGTGAVLEDKYISKLPVIRNHQNVTILGKPGDVEPEERVEETRVFVNGNSVLIIVGDSREGWVSSYQKILELSSDTSFEENELFVTVDLGNIRGNGEMIKGFGGVANPIKLPGVYVRCADVLNGAVGRKLNSVECCLLIDEASVAVVAGNVRRSAGMRQFDADDEIAKTAKDNLWQQDEDGAWKIDPNRDALRMANHTRVFHRQPTRQEIREAVTKQYYSGEGAIQYAPEAIARCNVDILNTPELKEEFIQVYETLGYEETAIWMEDAFNLSSEEVEDRLGRYSTNPCGEIIGHNLHCNLSEVHLNRIGVLDYQTQYEAFYNGGVVAATLLNHVFEQPRYQKSRELDPIVGVSFTGLFDFFVHAFGLRWLQWWSEGRPDTREGFEFRRREAEYLTSWKEAATKGVWDYCDQHGLKRPNRCTTVQPAGTKSLLTGASSGWHPPKAARFIRRITFRRDDPVAMSCMDYGYNVIPSQSDKDENGRLLDNPFDPRVTEWLVELPTEVSWANIPGCDQIDISKFSAKAQFDFYMQVQKFYTTHNTSATIEFRENEIEELSDCIYESIRDHDGYISAALLARFDANETFPRLPFEPISKEKYEKMMDEVLDRQMFDDFTFSLMRHDTGAAELAGPAGCDSSKCLFKEEKPE